MSKKVDDLLDQMTLAEQVSLLAGRNMWNTVPNERLGVEKMRVSDGPGGVRGSKFDGPASMNVPCGNSYRSYLGYGTGAQHWRTVG